MDSGDNDKFEPLKRNEDLSNYQSSSLALDWRFGDLTGSSSCPSAPMVDSFCQNPWDQHSNPQALGLSNLNPQASESTFNALGFRKGGPVSMRTAADTMGWNPTPSSVLKGGILLPNVSGVLPQSLSQFPADSAFIERAARFSCFSGGNFGDIVNQLGFHESMNPYTRGIGMTQGQEDVLAGNALKVVSGGQCQNNEHNVAEAPINVSLSVDHGAAEGRPLNHERKSEGIRANQNEGREGHVMSGNDSDEAEFSGSGCQEEEPPRLHSGKALGSKKRKRSSQNLGLYQVRGGSSPIKGNAETQEKGDQNTIPTSNKSVGKQGKNGSQASEPPKEEYIHVRARRGQATNSHSLAERVRREKISERMKYLQDLVPGCSKVTGKAVMLDEIINYVQSLQRQVEFLSMKLATVNPRLDLNIEGLLAKDILQSRAGPSSLGFSPDVAMAYAQPSHPSQPGLISAGLPTMGNPSDELRRTMSQVAATTGGYREATQLSNVWEDELHNVVQMTFDTNAPSNSQDVNASLPPGHMKVEL